MKTCTGRVSWPRAVCCCAWRTPAPSQPGRGAQELLHNEVLTVDQVVERVDGVTTEDVKRAANQFLARDKLILAVVGPYRSDKQFQNAIKM